MLCAVIHTKLMFNVIVLMTLLGNGILTWQRLPQQIQGHCGERRCLHPVIQKTHCHQLLVYHALTSPSAATAYTSITNPAE